MPEFPKVVGSHREEKGSDPFNLFPFNIFPRNRKVMARPEASLQSHAAIS